MVTAESSSSFDGSSQIPVNRLIHHSRCRTWLDRSGMLSKLPLLRLPRGRSGEPRKSTFTASAIGIFLIVSFAIIGCGTGDTQKYAAALREWQNTQEFDLRSGTCINEATFDYQRCTESIAALKRISPPESLRELHLAYVESLGSLLAAHLLMEQLEQEGKRLLRAIGDDHNPDCETARYMRILPTGFKTACGIESAASMRAFEIRFQIDSALGAK